MQFLFGSKVQYTDIGSTISNNEAIGETSRAPYFELIQ